MKLSQNIQSLFKKRQAAIIALIGIAVFAAALYSASLNDATNSAISGRIVQDSDYGVEFSETFNLDVIGPDRNGTINPKAPFFITSIIVETTDNVANPVITLNQYYGLILGIMPLPGSEFKYFIIESENIPERNLNRITIEFNVPKSWFSENKINPEQVFMYNYKDSWELLETTYLRGDIQYNYYKASAYSFSPLAIGGQISVETPVLMGGYCGDGVCQDTESCSTCPIDCGKCPEITGLLYWLLFVLAGLIAAGALAYFIFIKNKKRKMSTTTHPAIKEKIKIIHKMVSLPPKRPKSATAEERIDKLTDFIQNMLKKGYSVATLQNALSNSRWTNIEIEKAFHLALTPPEKESELKIYINKMLNQGFNEASIKKRLLSKGWDLETVDHQLRLVSKRPGNPKAQ